MKAIFKIIGLFFITFAAFAEDYPDTILISGTRSTISSTSIPGQITVISKQDIINSQANSIADILKSMANLQVRDDFGDGSRTVISMRGFGENAAQNTLILLNGRRLNNTLDIAAPDLTVINIDEIEKIEIINGSMGALYGENAVGGMINIITRKIDDTQLSLNLKTGSYNLAQYSGYFSHQFAQGFGFNLLAKSHNSDNYRQHNDIDTDYFKTRLEQQHRYGKIYFEASYKDEYLQTPGALFSDQKNESRRSPNNYDDFIDTQSQIYQIGLDNDISTNWHTEAEFTWRDDNTNGFLTIGGFGSHLQQTRQQWSFNPRIIGTFDTNNGIDIITLGLDRELADYQLTSILGQQQAHQESTSAYAQLIYYFHPKLHALFAVRYIDIETELTDNFTFPNGNTARDNFTVNSIGINYQPNDFINFYVKRDENYRLAKVDEHTNQLFGSLEPLDSQTGISYEIGSEIKFNSLRLGINGYRLSLENEISFDPMLFANLNLDNTVRKGINVNFDYTINPTTNIGLNYSYVNAEFNHGMYKNNQIPFVAKHNITALLSHQVNSMIGTYIEYQYISDRYASGDSANNLEKIAGYHIVNTNINFTFKQFTVSARINNLFNQTYDNFGSRSFNPFPNEETAFFPAPKRNFVLTLSYKL